MIKAARGLQRKRIVLKIKTPKVCGLIECGAHALKKIPNHEQ